MLTQRALLLGVVAFCFYLIAVVNTLPGFYYLLTWLALGLLAAALGIALLSLQGLRCDLSLPRSAGHARWPGWEGEEEDAFAPRLGLDLQNTGTLNKTGILLEIRVLALENGEILKKRGKTRPFVLRFLIEALPSGTSQNATVPLGALGRGRFEIQSARLVASDVLGLFRAFKRLQWPANEPREIVVAPPLVQSLGNREAQRYASGQSGGRPLMQLGAGDELRGARPYASGDDWRHIHWPTTARVGHLVVREFERTGRVATLIVWDGAGGSDWGEAPFSSGEIGLTCVVSLLGALQAADVPVLLLLATQQSEVFNFQSLTGREIAPPILQAFAQAQTARETDLNEMVSQSLRGENHYDQIFLVTASLRADVSEVASFWRARGLAVTVLVVDAPAWAQASGDRRFRSATARSNAQQNDRAGSIAVTKSAFDQLERALSDKGARVVRLAPTPGADWRDDVERALLSALAN